MIQMIINYLQKLKSNKNKYLKEIIILNYIEYLIWII